MVAHPCNTGVSFLQEFWDKSKLKFFTFILVCGRIVEANYAIRRVSVANEK